MTLLQRQGTKNVLSYCPGQVELPSGQVTFHSHLPVGQVIYQVNH